MAVERGSSEQNCDIDGEMRLTCTHCRKRIERIASLSSHLHREPIADAAALDQPAGNGLEQRRLKSGSAGQRANDELAAVFGMW